MNILIIAPHADDEVFGCGGIIQKLRKKNHTIHICYVTKPTQPRWSNEYIEKRIKEIEKVKSILGISNVFNLDFPTTELDKIGQTELNNKLSNVIEQSKPYVLFIPNLNDIHKDHRLTAESCLLAFKYNFIKYILSYEIMGDTSYLNNFNPNIYVDISKEITLKLKACDVYSSEMKEWPHPRSIEGLLRLAKFRGMQSGYLYAEAFSLLRGIYE